MICHNGSNPLFFGGTVFAKPRTGIFVFHPATSIMGEGWGTAEHLLTSLVFGDPLFPKTMRPDGRRESGRLPVPARQKGLTITQQLMRRWKECRLHL